MLSDSGRASAHAQPNVVVLFPSRYEGERNVERINLFAFYDLSEWLKEPTRIVLPANARDCFYPFMRARHALTMLVNGSPIQLGISLASAVALRDHADRLLNSYVFEGEKLKEPPQEMPDWEVGFYRQLLERFETVFAEEMKESAAYYVPRRGIFYIPALVDSADESIPKDLQSALPDKSRNDWKAAGRCLAFNLLSASGFHVARAVEGTVEAYYQFFSGKLGHTLNSWNDYVVALEKLVAANPVPKPSEKVIAELRQMKDDYRNPIVHPRVVLSEADARMLFNNGESLIIAMLQELIAARQTGVQPTLALAGGAATP